MLGGNNSRTDALLPRRGSAPANLPSLPAPATQRSLAAGRRQQPRPRSAPPAAGGSGATEADIQRLLRGPPRRGGDGGDVTASGLVLPPRLERERRQAGAEAAGPAGSPAGGEAGEAGEEGGRPLPPLFLGWCGSGIYFW
jgi:hypothetical protein